ncbi:MAG: hypothetical protein KGJ86_17615 [Chloroflexota bacterium]|nr:hypothetical protein [Chloroflexota bacterium]
MNAELLDPRGSRLEPPTPLAGRPATLGGRQLLIFDNEKLVGRPNYAPFVPALIDGLTQRAGAAGCQVIQRSIMGMRPAAIDALVREIQAVEPAGVVILFGDAGSLRENIVLAVRLEGCGIPTVTLVTPGAASLAGSMAQSYCPGLPLVALDLSYTDAAERVKEVVGGRVETAAQALTSGWDARQSDARLAGLAPVPAGARLEVAGADREPGPDLELLLERLDSLRAGDGLPVVPPTRGRVQRMLSVTRRRPDEVLRAECAPTGTALTIEKLAINAVMAGCRPEYFPIVVAATEAMCDDAYYLDTGAITTHSSGNAIVVSGPLARQVGMHAGGGCLGPGFRANASIGRAITLTVLNILRAVPGLSDMATLGSPAEYVYCFAENEEESPWPGLHTELYGPDTTSVIVVKAESPHNFLDEYSLNAEALLEVPVSALSTIAHNNAYRPGNVLLILNPQHAQVVASSGWSRSDVQRYIHEHARVPLAETLKHGTSPSRPDWMKGLDRVPITRSPEDVIVVVAGAHGPQSLVAPSWGFSYAVSRPVG